MTEKELKVEKDAKTAEIPSESKPSGSDLTRTGISVVREAGKEQSAVIRANGNTTTGVSGEGLQKEKVLNAKEEKASPSQEQCSVPQAEVSQIVLRKLGGGKWDISFTGKVTRRDINRLRITMGMEWNRMKRRERLKALGAARRKELANVED